MLGVRVCCVVAKNMCALHEFVSTALILSMRSVSIALCALIVLSAVL